MDTNYENQLEGHPQPSAPIPIHQPVVYQQLVPPLVHQPLVHQPVVYQQLVPPAHQYYIPPTPPSHLNVNESDNHTIFVVEEIPHNIRNRNDDNIDILVIYICAIIAFFIPFIGLFYLFCLRFCCGIPYPFTQNKRKAYKLLLVATLLGFLTEIILGSIFHDDIEHL